MNDTALTITGNLTTDPESRSSAGGTTVARLTVASTPRAFDKRSGEWIDGTTLFLRVVVFGYLAEHVVRSLHKGDRVIVSGVLRARVWENDDGTRGNAIELIAEEVGAALRFATVAISKATASAGQERVSA